MSKHKVELLDMHEKSATTHEYDIRLDDVPMTLKSVAVYSTKTQDMTFRLTLSNTSVKRHHDYPAIRRELLRVLAIVHGITGEL